MANESDLTFILKAKDEASDTLKNLGGSLQELANSAGKVASEAKKASESVHDLSAIFREHGIAGAAAALGHKTLENASESLKDKIKELAGEAGVAGDILKSFGPTGLAVSAAIGLVTGTVTEAIHEFAGFQAQSIKLETTLKSIGQSGKLVMTDLEDLGEKLSLKTIFDTESVEKAGVALGSLGFMTKESVEKTLPIIADFAAKTGRDLPSATSMMTRALIEPQRGFMMLAREMRNVSDSEIEHVRTMIQANQYEEARDFILQKMTKSAKGFASALTTGVNGSLKDLQKQSAVYFGETLQDLGTAIDKWIGLTDKLQIALNYMRQLNAERVKNKERADELASPLGQAEEQMQLAEAMQGRSETPDSSSFSRPLLSYLPGFRDARDAALEARKSELEQAAADQRAYAEDLYATAVLGRNANQSSTAEFGAGMDSTNKQKVENALQQTKGLDDYTDKLKEYQAKLKGVEEALQVAEEHQDKFGDKIPVLKDRMELLNNTLSTLFSKLQQVARTWDINLQVAGMGAFDKSVFDLAKQQYAATHEGVDPSMLRPSDLQGTPEWQAAVEQQRNLARATQGQSTTENAELQRYYDAARAANASHSQSAIKATQQRLNAAKATLDKFGTLSGPDATGFFQGEVSNQKTTDTSVDDAGSQAIRGLRDQLKETRYNVDLLQKGTSTGETEAQTEAFKFAMDQARSGTMSFQQALAEATPIIRDRMHAEAMLAAAQEQRAATIKDANTQGMREGGTLFSGLQRQWAAEAQDKGLTGTERQQYIDSKLTTYRSDAANTTVNDTVNMRKDTATKDFQSTIATMSDMDQQIQQQMFDLRQLALEGKIVQGSADWDARAQAIRENAAATERLKEAQGPLAQYIKDGQETWRTYQEAAVQALDQSASGLVDVATGAKTAQQAVADLVKSFASLAANAAFKSLAGTALTKLGLGSLLGLGGGAAAAGVGGTTVSFADALSSGVIPLANGGIVGPNGSIPLRRYASGGIATSPQLALYGEGSHNEAYVPLPDGRSIPVSLKGGQGGAPNIQNSFNVTVQTGGTGGQGQGQGNPQAVGEAVAASLRNMVVGIIHDQLRTGGSLNPVMG